MLQFCTVYYVTKEVYIIYIVFYYLFKKIYIEPGLQIALKKICIKVTIFPQYIA